MKTPVRIKTKQKPICLLLLFYFIICVVRYLLAIITSAYPTVSIDEFLYYSIARSIATEGKLLFRGQPADYSYIMYPLALSPVYLFFRDGSNYFRIIQLWNILLMSLAIFPVYGLAYDMTKDQSKSLLIAVISMLLPDFILGQMIFSEAIIYPLFYFVFYCAYKYIVTKKSSLLLYIGFSGALLYYTKPGAMLPSVILLLIFLFLSIKNKEHRQLLFSFAGIVALIITHIVFQLLLKYVFDYRGGTLSLYNTQIGGEYGWHLDIFFKAIPVYIYYFILSCGIIGVAYPVIFFRNWNKNERLFGASVLICLLIMIVGTAWTINRHEYASETIHLRYIAMYIPLALLFCFLSCHKDEKKERNAKTRKKPSVSLIAVLLFVCICSVLFGVGVNAGNDACYPFMSLSTLLLRNNISQSAQPVLIIIVIAICITLYTLLERYSDRKHLPYICAGILVLIMLANGTYDYMLMKNKANVSVAAEASETKKVIGSNEYVFVYTDERVIDGGLDVSNRSNINYVTMNDLFNHLYADNGCFEAFVPEASRGTIPKEAFQITDTIIFDRTVYQLLKLSPYVITENIPNVKYFCVAHPTKGKPMVDSIIGNVRANELAKGSTGILVIYNQDLLDQPLRMRFEIKSSIEQSLTVFSGSETKTVALMPGQAWYEVVFQNPKEAYNFSVNNASINLYQYELIPQST